MAVLRVDKFEDGTVGGWTAPGATLTNSTDTAAGGARSLKAVRVGTTGDSPVNAPSVLVTVGQAVTLTFKVRQTAARSIHCYAEMNPGYVYTEADGGAFIDSSAVPVNTWVTLTRTFTVPAGASEMTLTLRHNSAAAGDILYIDDIMLEQGGIGGNVSPSVSAGPDQTRAVGQPRHPHRRRRRHRRHDRVVRLDADRRDCGHPRRNRRDPHVHARQRRQLHLLGDGDGQRRSGVAA